MKRSINYLLLLFATSIAYSSCYKDDQATAHSSCIENTTTRNKSVNFFDLKSSSPYFNQAVANFRFTQLSKTYAGSTSCPMMNCSNSLSIQNNTSKKIIFYYNIIFSLNLAQWNYQGHATINAGSTIDIGQINSNCASLDLGQIVIQAAYITYL